MNSIWGNNILVSVFGESHGFEIGCVIDGLPSGIELDIEAIKEEVSRRSASSYDLATPRKEPDNFEIVSGFFEGKTTGTPLCAVIKNTNTRSHDYNKNLIRPSHADYTAFKRYKGYQDYRGGGHFSGRLTAPIVIAGAICKQVLTSLIPDLKIGSRIVSIGSIEDKKNLNWKEFEQLDLDPYFPIIDSDLKPEIQELVRSKRKSRDSVGGIVEVWILNTPAGIGNPIFNSVESQLSSIIFSIPAVKGIEFGLGFDLARSYGSEVNDGFYSEDGMIFTYTNNNGGINGGISNGMPINFKCAIKPTPSISQKQRTIDYSDKSNTEIEIHGRHDPCIVLRAPVVLESATAICILDLVLDSKKYK